LSLGNMSSAYKINKVRNMKYMSPEYEVTASLFTCRNDELIQTDNLTSYKLTTISTLLDKRQRKTFVKKH
jgi:hypothetical protein